MASFTGHHDYSLEDIQRIFKEGEFSSLVHAEATKNIQGKEVDIIQEQLAELVEKNAAQYGGSPFGYIYGGQVFCINGGWQEPGIRMIAEELHEEAEHLKNARTDVRQYLTYIANMLGKLDALSEGSMVSYCANIPRGLIEFSESLKKLDRHLSSSDGLVYGASKFKKDDPRAAAYFLHYDRVNEPINRFLFRRITR